MNNDKTLYLTKLPLRGEVNLQSDPNISCFLVSLLLLLGKGGLIRGEFHSGTYVDSYVQNLKDSGFILGNTPSVINVSNDQDCFDSCFLDTSDILNFYKIVLLLSKKGLVEVSGNKDFVGLYKYMGYFVEPKDENSVTLFNKTTENKDTLTFHETNLTFFLVSILIFLLSSKKFSISIPEINYEISLLIDLFKDCQLIENVTYGNFVTIYFNFENASESILSFDAPKDSEEFIFWSFASIITEGEIRVNGLSGKTVATTLKILADIGAGFEALNETSVKIWGRVGTKNLQNTSLLDISKHLTLTKLCILSLLSARENDLNLKMRMNVDEFKVLILDLNRLGSNIKVNDQDEITITEGKIKQGILYLTEGEEVNYAKLLFALGSGDKIGLKNFEGLTFYNQSLLKKITDLGGKFEQL